MTHLTVIDGTFDPEVPVVLDAPGNVRAALNYEARRNAERISAFIPGADESAGYADNLTSALSDVLTHVDRMCAERNRVRTTDLVRVGSRTISGVTGIEYAAETEPR